ncbi:hypothetical protein [Lysobacter xanthus]
MAGLVRAPRPRAWRSPVVLRRALAALLLAAVASGSLHARPAAASHAVPTKLIGVWQPDTREGRAACRRYRSAAPGSAGAWSALVGGAIVRRDVLHEVADMGEGDFLSVDRVVARGDDRWRVAGRLGIDGEPEPGPSDTRMDLALRGDVLEWRTTYEGRTERVRYRRCAPLPRG